MADIIYVDLDYVAPGYIVATLDGAADLSAAFGVSGAEIYAEADYSEPGYSASPVQGGFATLASADLVSQSTFGASSQVTKEFSASLYSEDTFAVTVTANKNFVADLASTSTFTATASVVRDAGYPTATITWDDQSDTWESWHGLFWDPRQGVVLQTRTSIAALPEVGLVSAANFNSAATVTATGGYVIDGSAALTATTSVNAVPERIQVSSATLDSAATVVVSGASTLSGQGAFDSAFTFYARTRTPGIVEADAALTSAATVTTQAGYVKSAAAALLAADFASIDAVATHSGQTDVIARFTVSATAGVIRGASAAPSSAVTVAVRGGYIPAAQTINLNSTSTLSGTAKSTGGARAALTSVSTMSVNGGLLLGGFANLEAFDFVLAVGRVVHLSVNRTWYVPYEERTFQVGARESLIVPYEDRVNIVANETRTQTVVYEERTFTPEE